MDQKTLPVRIGPLDDLKKELNDLFKKYDVAAFCTFYTPKYKSDPNANGYIASIFNPVTSWSKFKFDNSQVILDVPAFKNLTSKEKYELFNREYAFTSDLLFAISMKCAQRAMDFKETADGLVDSFGLTTGNAYTTDY